jgi:hypothetical protein
LDSFGDAFVYGVGSIAKLVKTILAFYGTTLNNEVAHFEGITEEFPWECEDVKTPRVQCLLVALDCSDSSKKKLKASKLDQNS